MSSSPDRAAHELHPSQRARPDAPTDSEGDWEDESIDDDMEYELAEGSAEDETEYEDGDYHGIYWAPTVGMYMLTYFLPRRFRRLW